MAWQLVATVHAVPVAPAPGTHAAVPWQSVSEQSGRSSLSLSWPSAQAVSTTGPPEEDDPPALLLPPPTLLLPTTTPEEPPPTLLLTTTPEEDPPMRLLLPAALDAGRELLCTALLPPLLAAALLEPARELLWPTLLPPVLLLDEEDELVSSSPVLLLVHPAAPRPTASTASESPRIKFLMVCFSSKGRSKRSFCPAAPPGLAASARA